MKIELDLPVPEGWRFVGYQVPDKGQGCIGVDGTFFIKNDYPETWFYLTFERIEPEILRARGTESEPKPVPCLGGRSDEL